MRNNTKCPLECMHCEFKPLADGNYSCICINGDGYIFKDWLKPDFGTVEDRIADTVPAEPFDF